MLKPPLQPMLLSTLEYPFNSEEYLFEIKWDGYRTLVFINNNKLFLQSRNKKDLTPYFPEFNKINNSINTNKIILDGEICILNQEGKPVFKELQGRLNNKKQKKTAANLIIFDILSIKNRDIYQLPLIERKKYLKELINEDNRLIICPYIKKEGKKLYEFVKAEKLEGIIAKKTDSPYEFKRSKYWYKIKIWQYSKVIILGYNLNKTSLVVGKYNKKNELINMGKIKIGLSKEETIALFNLLPTITLKDNHLSKKTIISNCRWVKPILKCKVRFTELTQHNTFRHGYAVELLL